VIPIISAAAIALPANAQHFENGLAGGKITSAEWQMLPEYCIDTQGFKYGKGQSPNSQKWVSILGDTFWALHHYCLAIVKFNRAQRFGTSPMIQRGFAHSSIPDFQYVIDHMPEKYILAPEILTYMGRAHLLLNDTKRADEAFAHARMAKPNYWPAYSWWASYLAAHGQPDKARTIAAEGLIHAPESRALQLILADLNSKSYRNDAK
jgi:hypothetical protein